MATATKTSKKSTTKKSAAPKAKKNAKKQKDSKPAPQQKKATKTVGVVDADMRTAKAVVRHGIRQGWDDKKIIATVTEKYPAYSEKRIPADIRWHRNPAHARDMAVGLPKTA